MGMIRYNWLRKRGYKIATVRIIHDHKFDDRWAELIMKKGKRTRRTIVHDAPIKAMMEEEKYDQ